MKKLLCTLLAFIILLLPIPAHAWREGGHHIIGLMAFDLLNKEEQAKLLSVLQEHSRYTKDFEPPEKLPNNEEVARWLIARAGYWPDAARQQPKYNRSTWNYERGPALTLACTLGPASR